MVTHLHIVFMALFMAGIISCGDPDRSSGPLDQLPQPIVAAVPATSCELDTGHLRDSEWDLWRNCALTTSIDAVDAVTACALLARGTPCRGSWPLIEISFDGKKMGSVRVTSSEWAWFVVPLEEQSVSGELKFAFTNDQVFRNEDINVSIRKIALLGAER